MPGRDTLALTIQQTAGPQKPVPFVLKKIMEIPPPNILEECDDDIEKEKLCSSSSEAVVAGSGPAGPGATGGVPPAAGGGGVGGGGGGGGNVSASLTPAIWERTIPYDGETFHLEYMDLDEFLLENGIPVTVDDQEARVPAGPGDHHDKKCVSRAVAATTGSGEVAATATVTVTTAGTAPDAAQDATVTVEECAAASTSSPSTRAPSPVGAKPEEPRAAPTLLPVKLEEQEQEREEEEEEEEEGEDEEEDGDEEEEGADEEEEEDDDEVSLAEEAPAVAVVKKRRTERKAAGRDTPSPLDPEAIEVDVQFQPDPTDLVLSSVPGGELFNPRKHKFSDEELKPQPMIKKAKKVYVPDEQKDDKYWSRRKKNNVAAKRSRDARRLKENQITVRASFLERENAALRQQVAELRKDCGRCKNSVARYLAQYGPL